MIHSAIARATPAEWVTQTASAVQKPSSVVCGPSSGMLSVVNEKTPLNAFFSSSSPRVGRMRAVSVSGNSKSVGVKSNIEGWLPRASASVQDARSVALSGIGRWR